MLPITAPISRFRVTRKRSHSNTTIRAPSSAPTAFASLGLSPNGWIRKQVKETKRIKIKRTRIRSTVLPPETAANHAVAPRQQGQPNSQTAGASHRDRYKE